MSFLTRLLVLFLAAALPSAAAVPDAPPGHVRRLSSADGLPDPVIYAIVQDARGFVWLGTEAGLVRHDGREFRSFGLRSADGRPVPRTDIATLHRGSDGTLWIGTWGGGLVRFDPVSERVERLRHQRGDPASLSDDRVQAILEDRAGTVWVGTFNGLNRLEPNGRSFVSVGLGDGGRPRLSDTRIWSLSQSPDGTIWVGTETGVDVLDPGGRVLASYRLAPESRRRPDNGRARVVSHDRSGVLWVGGQNGLFRFDATARAFRPFAAGPASLAGEIITSITEGPEGALWVGTLGRGLVRVSARRDGVTRYPPDPLSPGGLPHGDVRSLWVDRTGLLWVGTRGGGLAQLDLRPPVIEVLDGWWNERGAPSEVAAVYEDGRGGIWAGSLDGLRRWTPDGQESHYAHEADRPDSLSPDLVRAIVEDGEGRLWVGTLNGLDRFDPAANRAEHFRWQAGDPTSLSHNAVNALLRDRHGRLWVGTQNGLNRRDPESGGFVRHYAGDRGLSDDFIRVLLEDAAGTLWIGTEVGGVCRYRERESRFECFRRGDEAETLSDDRVFALREGHGGIWVGTASGLNRIDPRSGRVERWDRDRGVPAADVYGLLTDRAGALWMSSGRGLYWFDPEAGLSRAFTEAQGLRSLAFARGAAHAARDGSLLFGAQFGVARVHPDRLPVRDAAPLAITDVLVDEVRLAQPVGTLTQLNLPWRIKSFRVSVAALDYHSPGAHEFSCRLEGFEEEWRPAGPGGTVVYTNLDPGNYVLRVRLATGGAVIAQEGLALPVRITPPWWESMPFRIALFLLMTSITATIVVLRVAVLKRSQRELGRLVDERTTQLVDANRRLELLARTDGLTGLANYRAFSEILESEWLRGRRDNRPISVLMIDVDRFKTYNDTFGHRAGDAALRRVAGVIGGLGKREGDVVARYGGDEFAMVLPGTERGGAMRIGEHARQAVEALRLIGADTSETLTLSVGVATTVPGADMTAEDLLRLADQALYDAKRRGRNCVLSRLLAAPAPDGRVGA